MSGNGARIESLQARHKALAAKIEGKNRDTSLTDADIHCIKQQKLALKDEINRLQQDADAEDEPDDVASHGSPAADLHVVDATAELPASVITVAKTGAVAA